MKVSLPPMNTLNKASLDQGDASQPLDGDALAVQIYAELRMLAEIMLRQEPSGITLQPTALVHEAWVRLNARDKGFADEVHYYRADAHTALQVKRNTRALHGPNHVLYDSRRIESFAHGIDLE
jgi:hypothetical protein